MAATATQQQSPVRSDPLRHHKHYQQSTNGSSPYAGGSSFMERVSEAVASGMGTVGFLLVSSAIILAWVLANHVIHFLSNSWTGLLNGKGFDPAPFILLNLVFSAVAFYTGALVIIAQKAQTRTDKANEEAAAKHRDELAQYQEAAAKHRDELAQYQEVAAKHRDELAQQQTDLLERNTDLTEQIHTLSQKLSMLTEEVHEATCKATGRHPIGGPPPGPSPA
jgi:uncharacterized membrane protein